MDLMAIQRSWKVPFFYSQNKQDKGAAALDRLAQDIDWSKWKNSYCFPPFSLIGAQLGLHHPLR